MATKNTGRFTNIRQGGADWGISPPHLEWDFIQDVWVKGNPPGTGYVRTTGGGGVLTEVAVDPVLARVPLNIDALGNLRVSITGGGPGFSEVAVLLSDGVTRMPLLRDDASGALLVTSVDPTGTPVYIPIGGVAPLDYIQTFEMAPSGGMYRAVLPTLNNGDAVLPTLDQEGRIIISPSTGGYEPIIEKADSGVGPLTITYGGVALPAGVTGWELEGLLIRNSGVNEMIFQLSYEKDGAHTAVIDYDSISPGQNTLMWTPPNGSKVTFGADDLFHCNIVSGTAEVIFLGRHLS